jgi:hypothetical protein
MRYRWTLAAESLCFRLRDRFIITTQSLRNRCGIALQSLRNYRHSCAITAQKILDRCPKHCALLRYPWIIATESLCDHCAFDL